LARILRLYAIREVVVPTLVALLTIAFLLMMRYLFDLINLLMQPGVGAGRVGYLLACLLPSVLVFAAPMAILIGVLVGIGRMILDREVLAIRASGINLFSIFAPVLGLALTLSAAVYWLSAGPVPAMMRQAILQIGQLKIELANSLEPGRFHEDLFSGNAILYFREREPRTNRMLGITVEMESNVDAASEEPDRGAPAAADGDAPTSATRPEWAEAGALADEALDVLMANLRRETELTLICAESGEISIPKGMEEGAGSADAELLLKLANGSVHVLDANPGERDYTVLTFKTAERRMFEKSRIERHNETAGNAELLERIEYWRTAPETGGGRRAQERIGALRKELWQRRSIWPASFVFALVGIPLAIWVRPSGKSWGILIAIGLMLVYYVILQMGLTMVQEFQPAGILVALLPNLVYGLLGAALWLQTLRS
jgi:lipopolysaccharide export system permease protein